MQSALKTFVGKTEKKITIHFYGGHHFTGYVTQYDSNGIVTFKHEPGPNGETTAHFEAKGVVLIDS
ncbi:MAG: hypothetical protein ABI430_00525 [Candidatus Taylorbacteria bacterium]